jgi:ABC-type nickel/cobalt efflux system permease component RcnA
MLTYVLNTIPFLVLVVISLVAFRMSKPHGKQLIDSPWFWVFAFTTVGLLGIWAISHKYDDREKRLEARYEARQRLAHTEAAGNEPAATSSTTTAHDGQTGVYGNDEANQIGYSTTRKVPLQFLALGLAIASCASAAVLWRKSGAE